MYKNFILLVLCIIYAYMRSVLISVGLLNSELYTTFRTRSHVDEHKNISAFIKL